MARYLPDASGPSARAGGAIRSLRILVLLPLLLLVVAFLFWFVNSANPETGAGYVGYVTQGSYFGHSRFLATQAGPTSYGRTWLAHVVNVSITPYTYDELFKFEDNTSLISKEGLKVAGGIHLVWRVNPDRVKDFIEHYSTLGASGNDPDALVHEAYDNFLKEQLRTFVRNEIQKIDAFEIPSHIEEVGAKLQALVSRLTASTPFEATGVVLGNIQFPPQVSDAISEKLATQQRLATKATELEIANKQAEIRVAEAQGLGDAMDKVNQKLTPLYIQHEAIEMQKGLVSSPNHVFYFLPVGPMGVPLTNIIPQPPQDAEKK